MPRDIGERVEVRRLMNWFNDKFFAEVSEPLVNERIYKRYIPSGRGGGPPDTEAMRAARANMRYHLAYIGWLVRTRDWLAGERLTYADLAAAAHLSAIDYLGDVPWSEDEAAKTWYARVKSRPSFRPLLAERCPACRRRQATPTSTSRRLPADDQGRADRKPGAGEQGFDVVGVARPDSIPLAPERLAHFLDRRRARRHGLDGGDRRAARRSARAVGRGALASSCWAELRAGRRSARGPGAADARRDLGLCAAATTITRSSSSG